MKLPPLLAALLLSAGSLAAEPTPIDPQLFEFDRAAPIDLQEAGRETRDGALVRDISFAGASGRVTAFLVSPAETSGSRAAVLWVHWFGNPATTNRTQFLPEAVALARRGVVSLLVDGMWSKKGWWGARKTDTDLPQGIAQVNDLRRAMDLLLAQPGVDAGRVAVVGHDFGAMYASIAAALDGRARTLVFAAPTARMSNWYLFTYKFSPEETAAYRARLRPLDPVEWTARLAPRSVLFQFAATDKYVAAQDAAEQYAAAGPRKAMVTYDTDHEMHVPAVAEDRAAWLVRELGLK